MTPIRSSKLSPSVESLRSFRPRPTETSSGMRNAIAESRRHMYRLLRSLKNAECSPTGGFFAYDSLRSIAVFLKKSIRCLVRRSSYHRPFSATRRIEGDPMGRPYAAASAALPPFLHPHLGRHRSGIADVLVVMPLVAAGEMV